jgi:hypothetical protein
LLDLLDDGRPVQEGDTVVVDLATEAGGEP